MKRNLFILSRRYQAALRSYLEQGGQAGVVPAQRVGGEALAAGLQTLDIAKLHEQTLLSELLPVCPAAERAALIKKAGAFFAMAITPIEKTHRSALKATARLKKIVAILSRRTVELAASNLKLNREIIQRKAVEEALKKSERHYSQSLEQSDRLQEELRRLSSQILLAQEDERKKISRELHDVIAQTLTAINVRLATLKKEAALNINGLDRNISRTQRLVEKSVNIVHRFARELRPAVLDDLGLIPALHSFLKNFTARTGVRTHLTAFADIEKLDAARRMVLFRVAQEALTNVARHARAVRVDVTIRKLPEHACMSIKDDGRSFNVERIMRGGGSKRLGLLGMRERLEMIGGRFDVVSAPGTGTTITAQIPFVKKARAGRTDSVR